MCVLLLLAFAHVCVCALHCVVCFQLELKPGLPGCLHCPLQTSSCAAVRPLAVSVCIATVCAVLAVLCYTLDCVMQQHDMSCNTMRMPVLRMPLERNTAGGVCTRLCHTSATAVTHIDDSCMRSTLLAHSRTTCAHSEVCKTAVYRGFCTPTAVVAWLLQSG